jgi:hypothetical protein
MAKIRSSLSVNDAGSGCSSVALSLQGPAFPVAAIRDLANLMEEAANADHNLSGKTTVKVHIPYDAVEKVVSANLRLFGYVPTDKAQAVAKAITELL